MTRAKHVLRVSIAMLLFAAMFAGLAVSPASAAGSATITIHSRSCPSNFSGDIFTACHGNLLARSYNVHGVALSVGSSGNGSVTVSSGKMTISTAAGSGAVYCSHDGGQTISDAFDSVTTGAVRITALNHSNVTCDWYNFFAPAPKGVTITIHDLRCPSSTKGDIFAACHGNKVENTRFTVTGGPYPNYYTNDDGVAIAPSVTAGAINITEHGFASLATSGSATVYCSADDGGSVDASFTTTTGSIVYSLADGASVICDWYNLTK